ncbi:golgin subfamily A member 3-like isoform X2 [Bacillus rossius redtenbacheri]|uniref:golgin subfamily A member 3-like isoform X2 n=1 Tax=Bacillus rossius redtenbacheri TaxID=93214 RepID=UPI002FDE0673
MEKVDIFVEQVNYNAEHDIFFASVEVDDPVKALGDVVDPNTDFKAEEVPNSSNPSPSRSFDLPAASAGTARRRASSPERGRTDSPLLRLMSLNREYNLEGRSPDMTSLPMVHAYVSMATQDKMAAADATTVRGHQREETRRVEPRGSIISLDGGTGSQYCVGEEVGGGQNWDPAGRGNVLAGRANGSMTTADQVAWEFRAARDALETASNFSGCSSRFDVESNCSDRAETMSTISTVSGYEEEMFRIKRLLLMDAEATSPQKPKELRKEFRYDDKQNGHPKNLLNGGSFDSVNNSEGSVFEIPHLKMQLQDAIQMKEKYKEALELSTSESLEWQGKYQESSRQKAHIEGRLESLKTELESLRQKLATNETENKSRRAMEGKVVFQEMEKMTCEHAKIQQMSRDVQNKNQELSLQLEFKETALTHAKNELQECESANEKLRIQLHELQVEMDSKDGAIQGLKAKIASLHVESQAHLQANVKANNTILRLKGEIDSLNKSSQWYCDQLHACQEAKVKVQQELMTCQSNMMSQSHLVEKLKTEVVDLQHECEDTRNRAIKEKESLMRKLEVIQADILEREAILLSQIQHGEASETLTTITNKLRKIDEEKCERASNLGFTVKDLEQEVQLLKNELNNKNDKLQALEANNAELMVRITTVQKTLNERELCIQNLQNNYMSLESALSKERNSLKDRDNLYHELMAEKINLEVSLKTETKEKTEINEVIEKLRTDFLNVSRNYQAMKADLRHKENLILNLEKLLKELQADKHNLALKNEELAVVEKRASDSAEQQKSLERTVARLTETLAVREQQLVAEGQTVELLRSDLQRKEALVGELQSAKQQLEENWRKEKAVSKAMSDRPLQFETPGDVMRELELARHPNREHSDSRKKATKDTKHASSQTENESREIRTSSLEHQTHQEHRFCDWNKIESFSKQKNFEGNVQVSKRFQQLCSLIVETRSMLGNSLGRRTKQADLTGDQCESVESLCAAVAAVNEDVKALLSGGVGSEREGAASHACRREVERLKAMLRLSETEHREKHRCYELNVRTLLKKVKEHLRGRRAAEKRLKDAQAMVEESAGVRATCEEHARAAERLRQELLRSEKERGRLEEAARERPSPAGPGDAAGAEPLELRARELQLQRSREKEAELEEELRKSKIIMKELRKEVFREKCESSRLRKQASSLQVGLDAAGEELDGRRVDLGRSEAMCELLRKGGERLQRELEREQRAHEDARQELEELRASLQDSRAKDPVLADQIKTLSYHLHQKTREVEALQQSARLAEARRRAEEQRLGRDAAALRGELDSLRGELDASRADRFSLQAQAAELRAALQCSLDSSRLLKAKLESLGCDAGDRERPPDLTSSLPAPPARYDEARIAALLAQSSAPLRGTPLGNLRGCLDSLKLEMSALQEQITARTSADRERHKMQ